MTSLRLAKWENFMLASETGLGLSAKFTWARLPVFLSSSKVGAGSGSRGPCIGPFSAKARPSPSDESGGRKDQFPPHLTHSYVRLL